MNSKVVLITGASSGIGEATARRLASAGHQVFLGARRTDRLATISAEIAIPASAIADAINYAITQPAEVDVNELVIRPTAQG